MVNRTISGAFLLREVGRYLSEDLQGLDLLFSSQESAVIFVPAAFPQQQCSVFACTSYG